MEEIVYLSIRLGCTAYLLYKVWEQKKRIGKICDLLYTPRKKNGNGKGPPPESGKCGRCDGGHPFCLSG